MQPSRRPRVLVGPLFLVIVGALVFGAAAAVISLRLPRSYEATTTLLIGRSMTGSDPDYQDLLASQLLAQTYTELATTRPILTVVAKELNIDRTPQELAASMSVQVSGISPIVHITVRGPDPEAAAAVANAVARQLVNWKPTAESSGVEGLPGLRQTLATIDAQIALAQAESKQFQAQGAKTAPGALEASLSRLAALLSTRATLLQLIANTASNAVLVIESADRPTEPARFGIVLNVAAAALLGALLAAGGLFAVTETRALPGDPSMGK